MGISTDKMKTHWSSLFFVRWFIIQLPNLTDISVLGLSNQSKSSSFQSRKNFLSSSATSFVTATIATTMSDPESALALDQNKFKSNPRYMEYEVEMKYADDGKGNPRSRGILVRRYTGDSTPFQFPIRPVSLVKMARRATFSRTRFLPC